MTQHAVPHRPVRGAQHGRDFSCCIVTADDELLAAAEGLQVHVLGAGLQTASMRGCTRPAPTATPTCTTTRTSATPTPPTTRSWCRCSSTASTSSPPRPRRTRPTAATPSRPPTWRSPTTSTRKAALNFPCVRIQRDYRTSTDIIRMCRRRIRVPEMWYGDYLARSARRGSASAGCRAGRAVRRRDARGSSSPSGSTTPSGAWPRRSASCPRAGCVAASCHDPLPGLPEGSRSVKVDDRSRGGADRGRPPRQPRLRARRDQPLRGACHQRRHHRRSSTPRPDDVPRNAGSFRRIEVLLREGCVVGVPRIPHSGSLATTNVAQPGDQPGPGRVRPARRRATGWPRAAGHAAPATRCSAGPTRERRRRTSTSSSSATTAGPARRPATAG